MSGWGGVWTKAPKGGHLLDRGPAQALQVASVPFVSHKDCIERMKKFQYKVTENMVCAGGNGSDACKGDSGGPLTCARNGATTALEKERYLCGIVSWGTTCSRTRNYFYPGIYTDVTKFTGWIRKFMRTWWRHYWSKPLSF